MGNRTLLGGIGLVALTCGMGAGTGAWAAEAERAGAERAGDDNTIVITGQRIVDMTAAKTDTPLLITPQAISVIERQQIDVQNVQTVTQALRYIPGVLSELGGSDNRIETNQFLIRGFAANEYLDGLRLQAGTWATPQFDPYALDRIDALKGPASVLYGQASPGGLVALTSRRPSATAGGEVLFQTGSYGRVQGAGDVTGALTDDGALSYRLTGLVRDTETQVDHTKYRKWFIAPALTWQPDADTTLTLLTNYQEEPAAGFYNQIPSRGTAQPNRYGSIPTSFYGGEPDFDHMDRTQKSAGYALSHHLGGTWTVRQNLRYMHIDTDYRAVTFEALNADDRTLVRSPYVTNEALDTFAVDTQVQGEITTGALKHTLLVGVDYQNSRWDHVAAYSYGAAPTLDWMNPIYGKPVPTPTVIQNGLQSQSQTGVYAQDQIALGGLNIVLGGREDWFDSDARNRLANNSTSTLSDRTFTGRAGLVYLFDNGVAPYVNYATSFQPSTGVTFDGRQFQPTEGEQFEAGVKYQPLNFPGFVTAAVYQLTQTNVTTADPVHVGFSSQAGEIRAKGVELDGHLTPIDGLNLQASYAYIDDEITQYTGALRGKTPPGIAKHTATVWADYAPADGALAGLTMGGGVRYVGPSFGNYANAYQVDGVTLVDAVLGYDFAHLSSGLAGWSVQLNASNLFDRIYVASCGNLGCYYGIRRTFISNLRYAW
ncbi:TonB-dependent siderophore receptor [Nitrospirillum viridazoti]|nr:TonB-dependent siderophore receptor [Nitrospirillum amazonense]